MEIIDTKKDEYINILVSRKKLEWIAHNHILSNHAEYRLLQRDILIDRDLKKSILNSPLAWKSIIGTIYIALDLYRYIVVDDREYGSPIVVTFADTRDNPSAKGINVFEMAVVEYKKFIKKSKEA
jgi:hypothetical protein